MKTTQKLLLLCSFFISATACQKDTTEVDQEKPTIDLTAPGAFPQQCSEIKRGETFTFSAKFNDNIALGSYSLDIHHNFDHHSHSTEIDECTMDPVKTPVKPFLLVKTMDIPNGPSTYEATYSIDVPADVDPGNYHFMIQVADRSGWSTNKGLSIRITE